MLGGYPQTMFGQVAHSFAVGHPGCLHLAYSAFVKGNN